MSWTWKSTRRDSICTSVINGSLGKTWELFERKCKTWFPEIWRRPKCSTKASLWYLKWVYKKAGGFAQDRFLKDPSNLAMNAYRDVASAPSLDKPFQCLTTLIMKNFFICSINLPSFRLRPLLLVLSLHDKLYLPMFPIGSLYYWKASMRSPWSFLSSRPNKPSSLSLSS